VALKLTVVYQRQLGKKKTIVKAKVWNSLLKDILRLVLKGKGMNPVICPLLNIGDECVYSAVLVRY
jgi:hypothetical protein